MNQSIKDSFFALLRSGLWEQSVELKPYEPLDFDALFKLAEEQSVIGLVAAGLEHVKDRQIKKSDALLFLKKVYSLEGRNAEMNVFIEKLMRELRCEGIDVLLVKGQGVGQCYERPKWRSVGDVDLLLDVGNYQKAKDYFSSKTEVVGVEDIDKKHIGFTINSWTVELHGTLHNGLSRRSDKVIDEIQEDSLRGNFAMWRDGETDVPCPSPDNHILFVFTHILQHFFHGGVGLKQICDWCRLLWVSQKSLDGDLLKIRLERMGLISEWVAFASLAVEYLGFQADCMPLYCKSDMCKRKADRIVEYVIKKRRMRRTYYAKYRNSTSVFRRKIITIWRQLKESITFFGIFPLDTFRFLGFFFVEGVSRTRKTTKF